MRYFFVQKFSCKDLRLISCLLVARNETKDRLTSKTDYYKASQTKEKAVKSTKSNQRKKNSFRASFKSVWHEVKTWCYLGLNNFQLIVT